MADKKASRAHSEGKLWGLRFVKELLLFAVILVLLFTVVIGVSRVSGSSMYPTLQNGQPVIYLRLGKSYDKGDIVSVRMPNGEYYVKRVVAVSGDTVELKEGSLFVNGEAEESPYANGLTEPQQGVNYPLRVRSGQIFALGDNREGSIDSRTFGCFSVTQTRGRILFVK